MWDCARLVKGERKMIQWITEKAGVWLTILVGVVAAVGGYKYAAALYQADIADLQAQHALAMKEKLMSIDRKKSSRHSNWRMRGISTKRLGLSLSICVAMLSGCASSPTVIAPDCPEPVQIPASISQSDSESVSNFSKRVRDFLQKVQSFLSESPENTTP